MKELILVRHAKSSWNNPGLSDHDRPLNNRGKRDAPVMAQYLFEDLDKVDAIISSTAVRAKLTAKHFQKVFEDSLEFVDSTEDLYHASSDDILEVVSAIADQHNRVLIFGHNPGFTSFANLYAKEYIDNVPTCGIVGIRFNASQWSDVTKYNGIVTFFFYPKMFQ